MGRKPKPLPFKKGMRVVYLSNEYGRIAISEAEVSMVTTKDGQTVVYTRTPDRWGGYYKRSFSPVAGMFQENPYPLWKLIPLNGKNMKNLTKRAEKATKLFREYEERYREITVQVESEAKKWQYEEIARRTEGLPNGPSMLKNVIARLGFKRPNLVKVRINGEITTTRG